MGTPFIFSDQLLAAPQSHGLVKKRCGGIGAVVALGRG
jgi:hypothetical protein